MHTRFESTNLMQKVIQTTVELCGDEQLITDARNAA